jgi:hypothetical protein
VWRWTSLVWGEILGSQEEVIGPSFDLLLVTFSVEGDRISVTHLLNVPCNAHLTQLLLLLFFLLLREVSHDETFFSHEGGLDLVLVVLALDRAAPRLNLSVPIRAHFDLR